MAKTKSMRQVRFLLGSDALSPKQKNKLKRELHSGAVKIKRSKKKKGR